MVPNFDLNKFTNRRCLTEETRNKLIAKSKKGNQYKSKEGNRWDAKSNISVASTVKDYNKIDMDTLWKKDLLTFGIRVKGETDNYIVTVEFDNILNTIQDKVKKNNNELSKKLIYVSLVEALNNRDIKLDCSCADWKYRLKYSATQKGYNAGQAENREAKITNPDDNLGAACKHILCVLNNAEWVRNVASVINNYINYSKDNMENLYSKYIFPKIYGMPYNKAVQMTIDYYDDKGNVKDKFDSDEAAINLSNALGKERGKFKKGSNKNPVTGTGGKKNK